jgi:broad specificity phosphatase PhoE
MQTAIIVADPHGVAPEATTSLIECDLGRWEGLDWTTLRKCEPEAHARFLATLAHPDGESYRDVWNRVSPAIEALLDRHRGESIVIVSHHVVLRTYLAGLLGLPPERAREVSVQNGSISTVVREGGETRIIKLGDTSHLQNLECAEG